MSNKKVATCYDEKIVLQINEANMVLKKKLEEVSRMRECAQLQLEMLKLHTPKCLEILESLKEITDGIDK